MYNKLLSSLALQIKLPPQYNYFLGSTLYGSFLFVC